MKTRGGWYRTTPYFFGRRRLRSRHLTRARIALAGMLQPFALRQPASQARNPLVRRLTKLIIDIQAFWKRVAMPTSESKSLPKAHTDGELLQRRNMKAATSIAMRTSSGRCGLVVPIRFREPYALGSARGTNFKPSSQVRRAEQTIRCETISARRISLSARSKLQKMSSNRSCRRARRCRQPRWASCAALTSAPDRSSHRVRRLQSQCPQTNLRRLSQVMCDLSNNPPCKETTLRQVVDSDRLFEQCISIVLE